MSRPLAVFRTESSARSGLGHLVRCAALAELLETTGWDCTFVLPPDSAEAAAASLPAHWPTEILPSADPAEAQAALQQRWPDGCNLLVVDHYGSDADEETMLRGWAHRILVIDDLANRPHDCDLLLDQTAGRTPAAYRGLVPPGCRVLAGLDFVLLRRQFALLRPAALARRAAMGETRRLLLSMGGADADNFTARVLDAIAHLPLQIDIVMGAAAPHLAEIKARAERATNIRVLTGVKAMGSLLLSADLAVGAGGMSSWERACLGPPSVVVVAADNQRPGAQHLADHGAALVVEADAALGDVIAALAADLPRREAMAHAAAALCDGRGGWRALLALIDPVSAGDGGKVTLRLAEAVDAAIMHQWQCAPETRRHSRNQVPPTLDEHLRWFEKTLWDGKRLLTVIEHDACPVGVLRFDRLPDGGSFEVSILVAPECHGRGIGSSALALARALMPGVRLVAEVDPANAASLRIFAKAGFVACDDRHLQWSAAA